LQDQTPIPVFRSEATRFVPEKLFRPKHWADGQKIWLHAVLFILTVASTFFVGLNDGVSGALWYSGEPGQPPLAPPAGSQPERPKEQPA
jgi:hypothetical protein